MSAVKRNVVWLLLSQSATWILSIALLIVVPREVGDDAFGRLSFAIAYVAFFELFGLFGSGTYLVKTIARDHDGLGRYVSNTLALKVLLAAVLSALAIGSALVIGFDRETTLLIVVYCTSLWFNLINNTLVSGLAGLQRMGRPAMWEVVRLYVGGVVGLVVLTLTGSIVLFALATCLAGVIPVVANGLSLRSYLRTGEGISIAMWKQVLVGGFPFFILSALLVIYGSIDIPMLKAMTDSETVGWYALAYRWVSMPAFFAATVATAFFPALAAEGVKVTPAFTSLANRALQFVLFVSVPAAIGIALIANDFVALLYRGEFAQSVPLIRLLALCIPVVAMDIVLGTVIVSADRQRQWVLFSVAAAFFNPLANLVAIPLTVTWFDNGAIGAAFTTVVTELILMAGAIALRPAGVLDRATMRIVVRIVGAGLAMIPTVLVLGSTPLVVQILAGTVAYALASVALRTISPREIRGWAAEMMESRRTPVAVAPATLVRSSDTTP